MVEEEGNGVTSPKKAVFVFGLTLVRSVDTKIVKENLVIAVTGPVTHGPQTKPRYFCERRWHGYKTRPFFK